MTWVYLSPHFDDVALSCGGLLWEQVQAGELVSIWTVCAGDPPLGKLSPFAQELHDRWKAGQNAPDERRREDVKSCQRLGVGYRYFPIPDCIYRHLPETGEFMYAQEMALNGPLHPGDAILAQDLVSDLRRSLPVGATLVSPLALGSHVDHQLTRLAAEGLRGECWYYADFPYVLRDDAQLQHMQQDGWESSIFPVSLAGLAAWQDAISAHASQISTFWESEVAMRQAITDYLHKNNGNRLWRKPTH
jgi:LmbE family N-acetylglucosaminyl deacetylase